MARNTGSADKTQIICRNTPRSRCYLVDRGDAREGPDKTPTTAWGHRHAKASDEHCIS